MSVEKRRQADALRGLMLVGEPKTKEEAEVAFEDLGDALRAAQSTDDPNFVWVYNDLCERYRAMKEKWGF